MKNIIAGILLLAFLLIPLACAQVNEPENASGYEGAPAETSQETDETEANPNPDLPKVPGPLAYFNEEGISFAYERSLADEAVLERRDGSPEDLVAPMPDHTLITFTGYALTDPFMNPAISIFNPGCYSEIIDYAAENIKTLQEVLEGAQSLEQMEEMPFLPVFNAGQVFYSNPLLLEFQGGRGLRYLTGYAQDTVPIVNRFLFYTFQGLTDDRHYYISVVMPVEYPALPADLEEFYSIIDHDYEDFYDHYAEYLSEGKALLEAAAADEFTPSLKLLDELVMSIKIDQR